MSAPAYPLCLLYAISGSKAAPTVRRVPLNAAMQQEVTFHFTSAHEEFEPPDALIQPYALGWKPDQGELVQFTDFALPDQLRPLGNAMSPTLEVADYRFISEDAYAFVAVFTGAKPPSDSVLLFQAIENTQVIRQERLMMFWSHDTFAKVDAGSIVLRDSLDAMVGGILQNEEHRRA